MKKIFFLALALLAPVVIYLFLQSFGDNQYELPVLYQSEVATIQGCEDVSVPYSLPENIYASNEYMAIIIDLRLGDVDQKFINNELTRINQYFGKPTFGYRLIDENIDTVSPDNGDSRQALLDYARCVLRYEENNSFITLVDKQGRIRSYFNTSKKQDFDRLITEIEILNKFE